MKRQRNSAVVAGSLLAVGSVVLAGCASTSNSVDTSGSSDLNRAAAAPKQDGLNPQLTTFKDLAPQDTNPNNGLTYTGTASYGPDTAWYKAFQCWGSDYEQTQDTWNPFGPKDINDQANWPAELWKRWSWTPAAPSQSLRSINYRVNLGGLRDGLGAQKGEVTKFGGERDTLHVRSPHLIGSCHNSKLENGYGQWVLTGAYGSGSVDIPFTIKGAAGVGKKTLALTWGQGNQSVWVGARCGLSSDETSTPYLCATGKLTSPRLWFYNPPPADQINNNYVGFVGSSVWTLPYRLNLVNQTGENITVVPEKSSGLAKTSALETPTIVKGSATTEDPETASIGYLRNVRTLATNTEMGATTQKNESPALQLYDPAVVEATRLGSAFTTHYRVYVPKPGQPACSKESADCHYFRMRVVTTSKTPDRALTWPKSNGVEVKSGEWGPISQAAVECNATHNSKGYWEGFNRPSCVGAAEGRSSHMSDGPSGMTELDINFGPGQALISSNKVTFSNP